MRAPLSKELRLSLLRAAGGKTPAAFLKMLQGYDSLFDAEELLRPRGRDRVRRSRGGQIRVCSRGLGRRLQRAGRPRQLDLVSRKGLYRDSDWRGSCTKAHPVGDRADVDRGDFERRQRFAP